MTTLETLQKLRQEILMDCLVYNDDNMPVGSPENDVVLICIEVIDEYIQEVKESQS